MLTGSLASNMYGVVRGTQDTHFVVQVDDAGIHRIAEELAPGFILDPQASFETITMTMRYVLTSADGEFKVELFLLSDEPHDCERFRRRRERMFEGRPAYVPSPEDVIIAKLFWYHRARRRKDYEDIRHVVSVQAAKLDRAYLTSWCDHHGIRDLLEQLLREASPPPFTSSGPQMPAESPA
jgi:hypothetical protein